MGTSSATCSTCRPAGPVRQWKLSPTDLASPDKWDEYTEAKETMFLHTDTAEAPGTVIKSNDKMRARLEAMRHVPSRLDSTGQPCRQSSARIHRALTRGPGGVHLGCLASPAFAVPCCPE